MIINYKGKPAIILNKWMSRSCSNIHLYKLLIKNKLIMISEHCTDREFDYFNFFHDEGTEDEIVFRKGWGEKVYDYKL